MYARRTAMIELFTDSTATERIDELRYVQQGDDSQDDYAHYRGSVPSDNTWYQILAPPISETRWEHLLLLTTVTLEFAFSVAAPASGTFISPGGDGTGVEMRDLSTDAASDTEATSGLWVRNNSGTAATVQALGTSA